MPGPVYAREPAGTAQGRWPTVLQNFGAVPLSPGLIHFYFIIPLWEWTKASYYQWLHLPKA